MKVANFRALHDGRDVSGETSFVRFRPSGVASNAQEIITDMTKPKASRTTKAFITQFGASKVGKQNRRCLDDEPGYDSISDRDLVNVAPLQLGEEIVRIHWVALRLRRQRMREIFEVCILSLRRD